MSTPASTTANSGPGTSCAKPCGINCRTVTTHTVSTRSDILGHAQPDPGPRANPSAASPTTELPKGIQAALLLGSRHQRPSEQKTRVSGHDRLNGHTGISQPSASRVLSFSASRACQVSDDRLM